MTINPTVAKIKQFKCSVSKMWSVIILGPKIFGLRWSVVFRQTPLNALYRRPWWALLALQPHATGLQWARVATSIQISPAQGDTVDVTISTCRVPESASSVWCTVFYCCQVIVTVVGGEHPVVDVGHGIVASVTWVPANPQFIVVCLRQDSEHAVLGVVPVAVVTWLQVEPQLVAVIGCQLTE